MKTENRGEVGKGRRGGGGASAGMHKLKQRRDEVQRYGEWDLQHDLLLPALALTYSVLMRKGHRQIDRWTDSYSDRE